MRDNEALLLLYLSRRPPGAAILPGGYRISGESAPTSRSVAVEKLAPGCPYEQLELRVGGGEVTRETLPRGSRPLATGRGELGEKTSSGIRRTEEAPVYAERECGRCSGGMVHVGGSTEVRTAPCPDCRGTGRVFSYLYPKPKGRRGPWPSEQASAEGRRD